MTERYQEQAPYNQPIWPLSPEEVALAKQEREEIRLNEERARQRRAEGLAAMERMLGISEKSRDATMSAPVSYQSPQREQRHVAPIEDELKVVGRNLTVDGVPVHMSPRVGDELRRQYIEDKQSDGSNVDFEMINPKDDVTSFNGNDQAKLQAMLANDGLEIKASLVKAKTLKEQMGIEDGAEVLPLERSKLGILSKKNVIRVGVLALVGAAVAGAATFLPKSGEGSNNSAAAVALPGEAKVPAIKEIDVQAVISDCVDGEIGAAVASGIVSVSAGVAWNIPGGTEVFPKLNLGAWDHDSNPATAPVNEPQYLPVTANNVNLSIAVCDTKDKPAVKIENETLHVNLAEVTPQVAFEANAENKPELSALKQEDLDKLVAKQWLDQTAANELRKNMIDPKMALDATKETLHGVVEQMKQKDNKTGIAAVTALKQQLQAAIAKGLPAKADGTPFGVILDGELSNNRIQGIGVNAVANNAFAIDSPRITAEKINEPATKVK
jgi:hypothetical protein